MAPKKETKTNAVDGDAVIPTTSAPTPAQTVVEVGDGQQKSTDQGDTIQISRADLQALMTKFDDQAKKIEVLYKTADKGRLMRYDDADSKNALVKTVKVWVFEGKIVVATKLVSNKCEVILGKWTEEQTLDVIFEDGESKSAVDLLKFERNKTYQVAEILERRILSNGGEMLKVMLVGQDYNGKEIELSTNFIN